MSTSSPAAFDAPATDERAVAGLRVAVVPSSYHPHIGGVEEYVRNLAAELAGRGHDVEVWTVRRDDLPEEDVVDGIRLRRLAAPLPAAHPRSLAGFLRTAPAAAAAWLAAGSAFRPDLVHVHCFGPNGIYGGLVATRRRVPLVVTLQGETFMDDQDIFERSVVMRTALRATLRRTPWVTGCSAFTLEDARARFGLPADRGVVVFNGVGTTVAPDGAGTEAGPPADGPYVLALGRAVRKKGFDLLVRAFQQVATDHPAVRLVIGGGGDELAALRDLAERLGIGNRVELPGPLDRTAVARWMAGAELFVMPSRVEPFGIVVLEAWRAGTAVVATSRGGPPEFVRDGVDGILADPEDVPALARAIGGLLDDPARRRSVGAAGHARLGEFTHAAVAQRYEGLYRRALTGDD